MTCERWQAARLTRLGALLLAAVIAPIGSVGCARHITPAPEPVAVKSELQDTDLLQWFSDVVTTSVPGSLDATSAAVAIWDQQRTQSSLSTRMPDVVRSDVAPSRPSFESIPRLKVASVIEVAGLRTAHPGSSVRSRIVGLSRFVVLLQDGPESAVVLIGRDNGYWRYVPTAPVSAPGLLTASELAPNNRVLLATARGTVGKDWWLLGQDASGNEVLVSLGPGTSSTISPGAGKSPTVLDGKSTVFMGRP